METPWESEVATLINGLLAVQGEMLDTLTKKQQLLRDSDTDGLAAVNAEEEQLMAKLQEYLVQRQGLLDRAKEEGLPASSLLALTDSLPRSQKGRLQPTVRKASSQARLLRHHSLTNWVVIQRTLIHLSQMLEIIATGGRLQPTYGKGEPVNASGALVDRAI